jgi:DNA-binding transcriptional ArsR family regulator
MTKYNNKDLRGLLNITGAIADATRVRILMMLDIHELCVCQITEALKLAPSTISKHLSILEAADLINRRKVGRWVYYRLNDSKSPKLVKNALNLVTGCASQIKDIMEDRKKIKLLLKEDIADICKRLYHHDGNLKKSTGRKNGTRIKT